MYTEKQIQLVMWMPKPTDSDEYCHAENQLAS